MNKNRKKKESITDKIEIDIVNDDECTVCGENKEKHTFLSGMCDAHTHGLDKYGYAEIQMVLRYDNAIIARILNRAAEKILNGEIVQEDGKIIPNFFSDGAPMRLDKKVDSEGADIYRIIIPDGKFCWPEHSDEYPYNLQDKNPYLVF